MDDNNLFGGSPELVEARQIIDSLLNLAKRRGFGREAAEIVLGKKIPEPPSNPVGAPLVKNSRFRRALAMLVEFRALGTKGRRGAKSGVAREFARLEIEHNKSAAWRSDLEKRIRTRQNDLASLSQEEEIEAAYYVDCLTRGESAKVAKERFDRALSGDEEAGREVFARVRGLMPNTPHNNSDN